MEHHVSRDSVDQAQDGTIATDRAKMLVLPDDGAAVTQPQGGASSSVKVSLSQKRNRPPLKLHLHPRKKRVNCGTPIHRPTGATPYPRPHPPTSRAEKSQVQETTNFASQLLVVARSVAELTRRQTEHISRQTRSVRTGDDWIQSKHDQIFAQFQTLADRHYDEVERAFAHSRVGNANQQEKDAVR